MAVININAGTDTSAVRLKEGAAPSTPPSGYVNVYVKTDGRAYSKDDAGTEYTLSWLPVAPPDIGGTTPAAGAFTTLSATGDFTLSGKAKPATDSTTAIRIANAAGTAIASFDTSNGRFRIGDATAPTAPLDVLGQFTVSASGTITRVGNDANFLLSASNLRLNGAAVTLSNNSNGAMLFSQPTASGSSGSAGTVFTFRSNNAGTPTSGHGFTIAMQIKSSTANDRDAAYLRALWNDPTNSAAIGDLVLLAAHNASGTVTEREGVRVRGGASATQIGFFGATPVSKPALGTWSGLTTDQKLDALRDAFSTLGLASYS